MPLFASVLFFGACVIGHRPPLRTPLELGGYRTIPKSSELSEFLSALARSSPLARRLVVGSSAGGRALDLLLVSRDERFLAGPGRAGAGESGGKPDNLTVMLVGSQHGTEPSGAEAVLLLARELIAGTFPDYLKAFNFVLLPDSNPDGRDRHRRVNANGVNLSTDYGLLSQPESRAVNQVLQRWRPQVLLDLHESAVFKRKSLGRQGFMTDFEAQFEIANNPNVDPGIQGYSREKILPDLLSRVNAAGLRARHYIGEITDARQPITHGGLSMRNLRNKAGLMDTFSFLVENRLDSSLGVYPTPRNIERRVAKQFLCIKEFLATCHAHREEIADLAAAARRQWRVASGEKVAYLQPSYVSSPSQPQITLGLRKVDSGRRVLVRFTYQGVIDKGDELSLPGAYLIVTHEDKVGELLRRHGIEFETVGSPGKVSLAVECVAPSPDGPPRLGRMKYRLHSGDLVVRLRQPAGRLVPLLLEPGSAGGPLGTPPPPGLARPGEDPFICRMQDRPGA